jgi:hypothetical protein
MKAAKLSGPTWYLRSESQFNDETRYEVRCIWEGVQQTRDVTIVCAATVGPQRCSSTEGKRFFAQLQVAAANYCAQR